MKTLLYALLGLVLLLVAAILVGPSFINWSVYKEDIAAQLEETTGRRVAIGGDVSLEMLPRPRLALENVEVANAAEGQAPRLLRAEAVRVEVRLAPLLQGDVRLARVTLVRPEITVERLPDGRLNVAVATARRELRETIGLPFGADLRLEQVRLRDGTLNYRDLATGRGARVTGLTGRIALDGPRGPLRGEGRLAWRGLPLRFDGTVGGFADAGPSAFNVTLRPRDGGGEARLSGTVERMRPLRGEAELDISGPDLATVLGALRAPPPLPGALAAQPYDLAADLTLGGEGVQVADLSASLGELSVTGAARVRLGRPAEVETSLTMQRLDLDALLADLDRAAPGGATGDTGNTGGFALPAAVRAEIALSAGALVYNKQVVRQGEIRAQLAEGRLEVTQARALLPGGSDLSLTGALTTPERTPTFSGRVDAGSDNLRGLLDWLDVQVPGIPNDRLRRLSLGAALRARPERVTLTDLDLGIDTMAVRGGIVMALGGARPGFGVGVRINKLDLDAYWPEPAEGAPATEGPPRPLLDSFDANLDVRVDRLVVGGRQASAATLDGTLSAGDLNLRKLRAESVAGGPFTLDGAVTDLASAEPTFDLNVNWQDAEPGAALDWLGLGGSRAFDGLPRAGLSGRLRGRLPEMRVDLALQSLDGLVTGRGTVRDLIRGAPSCDLDVAVQHDSLADLVARLTDLPVPADATGGVDLSGRVTADAQGAQVRELGGALGPVQLSGRLDAGFDGPRPRLDVALETGDLPLAPFAPADLGWPGRGSGDWSAAPLGVGWLDAADAEVRIDAARLALAPDLALDAAEVRATMADGTLTLTRLGGSMGGGRLTANGTLAGGAAPALSLALQLDAVPAEALLAGGIGAVGVAGPLSGEITVEGAGRSELALVEDLSGQGRITGDVRLTLPDAGETSLLQATLGPYLPEGARTTEAARRIDAAFRDRPVRLDARVAVEAGTLRGGDVTLAGEGLTARLRGEANLPNWRTRARLDLIAPGADGADPFLAARLEGALGAPAVQVAGRAFDVAPPEAPEPISPEAPESPSRPEAPEAATAPETPEAETPEGESGAADTGPDDTNPDAAPDGERRRPSAEDIIDDLLRNRPRSDP